MPRPVIAELVGVKKLGQYNEITYLSDGKEYTKRLYDENLKKIANGFSAGEQIEVAFEEKEKEGKKYWNIIGLRPTGEVIREATPEAKSQTAIHPNTDPRQDSIETQVAVKAMVELIASKSVDLTNHFELELVQDTVAWIRARIPSSKPVSIGTNPKQQFLNACKEAGYSITTKQGLDAIKAWMVKAGKTELPFDELKPEKQNELIAIMQAEKLP